MSEKRLKSVTYPGHGKLRGLTTNEEESVVVVDEALQGIKNLTPERKAELRQQFEERMPPIPVVGFLDRLNRVEPDTDVFISSPGFRIKRVISGGAFQQRNDIYNYDPNKRYKFKYDFVIPVAGSQIVQLAWDFSGVSSLCRSCYHCNTSWVREDGSYGKDVALGVTTDSVSPYRVLPVTRKQTLGIGGRLSGEFILSPMVNGKITACGTTSSMAVPGGNLYSSCETFQSSVLSGVADVGSFYFEVMGPSGASNIVRGIMIVEESNYSLDGGINISNE